MKIQKILFILIFLCSMFIIFPRKTAFAYKGFIPEPGYLYYKPLWFNGLYPWDNLFQEFNFLNNFNNYNCNGSGFYGNFYFNPSLTRIPNILAGFGTGAITAPIIIPPPVVPLISPSPVTIPPSSISLPTPIITFPLPYTTITFPFTTPTGVTVIVTPFPNEPTGVYNGTWTSFTTGSTNLMDLTILNVDPFTFVIGTSTATLISNEFIPATISMSGIYSFPNFTLSGIYINPLTLITYTLELNCTYSGWGLLPRIIQGTYFIYDPLNISLDNGTFYVESYSLLL